MIELSVIRTEAPSGVAVWKLEPSAEICLGAVGSNKVEQLHVSLPEEWKDYTVRITFIPRDRSPVGILLPADGVVDITSDIVSGKWGTGEYVIDAVQGDRVAYTVGGRYTAYNHPKAGGGPQKNTPSEYHQILSAIAAGMVKGDPGETPYIGGNGNWFVGDVDTGIKAQGPKGDKGDAPVRGEDYWTQDDQSVIIATVLERVPEVKAVEALAGRTETAAAKSETARSAAETAQDKAEAASASASQSASASIQAADQAEASAGLAAQAAENAERSAQKAENQTSETIQKITELDQAKLDKPSAPPSAGKVLKVLSVNDDGTFVCEWADAFPDNGKEGQLLGQTAGGLAWVDPPQSGVQSDWNQNDENAPNHIKNRPFYDASTVTTIIPESTVTFTYNDVSKVFISAWPESFDLVEGQEYLVSWDGTDYVCTGSMFSGFPVLGNIGMSGFGDDTGEPFVFMLNGEWMVVSTENVTEHLISISAYDAQIVKIDKKFLPDDAPYKVPIVIKQDIKELSDDEKEQINDAFKSGNLILYGYDPDGLGLCSVITYFYFDKSSSLLKFTYFIGYRIHYYDSSVSQSEYTNDLSYNGIVESAEFAAKKLLQSEPLKYFVLTSSTSGSTKKFKITVGDDGALSTSEVTN